MLLNTVILTNYYTYSSFNSSKEQNKALIHKIEQERSFIKSTERTITARTRLSRNKGAIDKELEISLMRAQSTLASLESSLSSKVNILPNDKVILGY